MNIKEDKFDEVNVNVKEDESDEMKQHMLWSFKDHNHDKAKLQEAMLGFPADFIITESPKGVY